MRNFFSGEIDRLLVSRLHEEQRKKSDIKTVEEPMYNPWEEKGNLNLQKKKMFYTIIFFVCQVSFSIKQIIVLNR